MTLFRVPRFLLFQRSSSAVSFSTPYRIRRMSTKTIAVLDDAELQDGQMYVCILMHYDPLHSWSYATTFRKEVAFENGNVLLSRLGDKIHATSAYCTHYGAPLSTGVLSSDGRVVWYVHGGIQPQYRQ